jgi:hypothetical protein
MSAIEDVISALHVVVDQLGDAASASGAVAAETDEAMRHAVALGATHTVAELTALKEGVTRLGEQVAAAADSASEMLVRAQAVAGSS